MKYMNSDHIMMENYSVGVGNFYQIEAQLKEAYNNLKMSIY
jgi:hypothetical protein